MNKKIKDLLPTLRTDGSIFKYLGGYNYMTPLEMGVLYSVRSNYKYASSFLTYYNDVLTEEQQREVGNTLKSVYGRKWDKMAYLLNKEYDAFVNLDVLTRVDGSEINANSTQNMYGQQEITNVVGTNTVTNVLGEQETSNDYGEKTTTNNYGSVKTIDTMGESETITTHGAQLTTNNIGSKQTTTSNSKNAFNEGLTATDKTVVDDGAQTNSTNIASYIDDSLEPETINEHETNAHSDTITNNSYTDTTTIAETTNTTTNSGQTNTTTNGTHVDSVTQTLNKDIDNTTTTKGLQGITNQELLEKELEIRKFAFLDVVFADVDKFLTLKVY